MRKMFRLSAGCAFALNVTRTRVGAVSEYRNELSYDALLIVFHMPKHVIVSFTYNCNNGLLIRISNYLFIVSYYEQTSHLNKWPSKIN